MSEIAEQIGLELDELTQEFNIIAHNLANVNTTGYKRRCNTFSKSLLIAQAVGVETGSDERAVLNTIFDFSQGGLTQTGRSLDFALGGKGFFVIETPDGPLYTRNGVFSLNQNGQIVDSSSRIVAGENGPISIPPDVGVLQINVSSEGNISAGGTQIGKFKLVDFKDNENKLIAVGANCFQAPEGIIPEPPENLIVKQDFQESSNVRMIEEMVDMVMVSRLYEAGMKFLSADVDTAKSLISVAMG